MKLDRRALIMATATAPLLALPGCAGTRFSLVDAIRELLTLASQRAFANLLAENGFLNSAIARISIPDALGGARANRVVSAILNSEAFRSRLLTQLNRAAEKGAEIAAPLVTSAIQSVAFEDAVSLVRGGPEAATLYLKDRMGPALFTAMIPGIDRGLKLFDSGVIQEALRAATGVDLAGIRDDVTRKVSDSIYRAIGKEEAAIRANPSVTNNPTLIAIFGLAGRKR